MINNAPQTVFPLIADLYVIQYSVMNKFPDLNVFTVNANSGIWSEAQGKCWEQAYTCTATSLSTGRTHILETVLIV